MASPTARTLPCTTQIKTRSSGEQLMASPTERTLPCTTQIKTRSSPR